MPLEPPASARSEINVRQGDVEESLRDQELDPRVYGDVCAAINLAIAVVEADPTWYKAARSALRQIEPRLSPAVLAIADLAVEQAVTQVRRQKNGPKFGRPLALAALRAALDILAGTVPE